MNVSRNHPSTIILKVELIINFCVTAEVQVLFGKMSVNYMEAAIECGSDLPIEELWICFANVLKKLKISLGLPNVIFKTRQTLVVYLRISWS